MMHAHRLTRLNMLPVVFPCSQLRGWDTISPERQQVDFCGSWSDGFMFRKWKWVNWWTIIKQWITHHPKSDFRQSQIKLFMRLKSVSVTRVPSRNSSRMAAPSTVLSKIRSMWITCWSSLLSISESFCFISRDFVNVSGKIKSRGVSLHVHQVNSTTDKR